MPYFLQNFGKLIGSRAIDEFLKGRISEERLPVLIMAHGRVTLNEAQFEVYSHIEESWAKCLMASGQGTLASCGRLQKPAEVD